MSDALQTLTSNPESAGPMNGHAKRKIQPRKSVPITNTETIRHRLNMTSERFSEELGFNSSTYGGYLTKGKITKTAALAAEALMRRQAATGEIADEVFILRVIKGTPTAIRLSEMHKMTFDGKEFFLLPVKDTK